MWTTISGIPSGLKPSGVRQTKVSPIRFGAEPTSEAPQGMFNVLQAVSDDLDEYTIRPETFEGQKNSRKIRFKLYPKVEYKLNDLPHLDLGCLQAETSGVFGKGKPVLAFSVNYPTGDRRAHEQHYDSALYRFDAKPEKAMAECLKPFKMRPQHHLREIWKGWFGSPWSVLSRFPKHKQVQLAVEKQVQQLFFKVLEASGQQGLFQKVMHLHSAKES